MAQDKFFGNGIDATFKVPLNSAITSATVGGSGATVTARTPYSVTLSAVPAAGAAVVVNYTPMPRSDENASNPATTFAAVTPSDTVDQVQGVFDALWVGAGGDVAVLDPQTGTSVVFKNVASGFTLPVSSPRVMATGTTAQSLVALFN